MPGVHLKLKPICRVRPAEQAKTKAWPCRQTLPTSASCCFGTLMEEIPKALKHICMQQMGLSDW